MKGLPELSAERLNITESGLASPPVQNTSHESLCFLKRKPLPPARRRGIHRLHQTKDGKILLELLAQRSGKLLRATIHTDNSKLSRVAVQMGDLIKMPAMPRSQAQNLNRSVLVAPIRPVINESEGANLTMDKSSLCLAAHNSPS